MSHYERGTQERCGKVPGCNRRNVDDEFGQKGNERDPLIDTICENKIDVDYRNPSTDFEYKGAIELQKSIGNQKDAKEPPKTDLDQFGIARSFKKKSKMAPKKTLVSEETDFRKSVQFIGPADAGRVSRS